jgi:putative hydrolase of the HAD superfamily
MSYTTLFFDLDDTLYPGSNGLWALIRERMGWYMVEVLGLPESEVPALRRKYYETYGTTLRGLQIHHQVDVDDYLHYVHDLPLEQFLQPNPELRALLLSLPQQRWIFTNADADHARRVMSVLGVQDCFTGIIDIRALEFACKPELEAYQRALALAGDPAPEACVLLDDSASNLAGARQIGFSTVWVGQNGAAKFGAAHSVAQFTLSGLLELPLKMPSLWAEETGNKMPAPRTMNSPQ